MLIAMTCAGRTPIPTRASHPRSSARALLLLGASALAGCFNPGDANVGPATSAGRYGGRTNGSPLAGSATGSDRSAGCAAASAAAGDGTARGGTGAGGSAGTAR